MPLGFMGQGSEGSQSRKNGARGRVLTVKSGPPGDPGQTNELAQFKRKLAAILAADVKSYSRVMEADEEGTLHLLKRYRRTVDAFIDRHDGRLVGTAGD